jgi:hypothetical protein
LEISAKRSLPLISHSVEIPNRLIWKLCCTQFTISLGERRLIADGDSFFQLQELDFVIHPEFTSIAISELAIHARDEVISVAFVQVVLMEHLEEMVFG